MRMAGLASMLCAALAFHGIVGAATESRAEDSGKLTLAAEPAFSVLKADQKQATWLRVGVTGFTLEAQKKRTPVNLAIVLDRSGSMQGEKIEKAREAAISALDLLTADDIVSIVVYDTNVQVLIPATRMTDKEQMVTAIRGIQPGGNTALFAGVSKGAAEVRKFLDAGRVNRIVLLSDGLANSGPSSPSELGSLGASLKKENITVSTLGLGLGYNEDLMVELAGKSGGNHQFVENATELADVFRREFSDALSVVAQEIDVRVMIPEGLRPVRVLGNAADINGQTIVTRLSQLYSRQTRYVVVEVEIPQSLAKVTSEPAAITPLCSVDVSYRNMTNEAVECLTGTVAVSFSESDDAVQKSRNNAVMADVVELVASEQNKLATQLLDAGDVAGCRNLLTENRLFLESNATLLESKVLEESARVNALQLDSLLGVDSKAAPGAVTSRKSMRAYQYQKDSQADNVPKQ